MNGKRDLSPNEFHSVPIENWKRNWKMAVRAIVLSGIATGIARYILWPPNAGRANFMDFFIDYLMLPLGGLLAIAFIDLMIVRTIFEMAGYGQLGKIAEIDFASYRDRSVAKHLAWVYVVLSVICFFLYWYSIPLQFLLIGFVFLK